MKVGLERKEKAVYRRMLLIIRAAARTKIHIGSAWHYQQTREGTENGKDNRAEKPHGVLRRHAVDLRRPGVPRRSHRDVALRGRVWASERTAGGGGGGGRVVGPGPQSATKVGCHERDGEAVGAHVTPSQKTTRKICPGQR